MPSQLHPGLHRGRPTFPHCDHLSALLPARSQELSNLLWSMAAMDYYPGPTVMDPLSRVSPGVVAHLSQVVVALVSQVLAQWWGGGTREPGASPEICGPGMPSPGLVPTCPLCAS